MAWPFCQSTLGVEELLGLAVRTKRNTPSNPRRSHQAQCSTNRNAPRSCPSAMVPSFVWCPRNVGFFMGLSRGVIAEVDKGGGSRGSVFCSEGLQLGKVSARKLQRWDVVFSAGGVGSSAADRVAAASPRPATSARFASQSTRCAFDRPPPPLPPPPKKTPHPTFAAGASGCAAGPPPPPPPPPPRALACRVGCGVADR